jgi:catechol 2,3-dioxygenase-like lactoylglutathione lyase family enzyme
MFRKITIYVHKSSSINVFSGGDNMTTVKEAGLATIDMKLEVIVIPVSDAERAEQFYRKLGWRQDVTPPGSGVFQFTPHGSACSVQFGRNLTSATPGSAQRTYLIVSDLEAARQAIVAAKIEVSEIFHLGPNGPVGGPDPEHGTYRSLATFSDPDGNSWLLQEITTRLPGRIDSGVTSFGSVTDLVGALRRAEAAHGEHEKRTGSARCQLGGLVRRLHGGGTDRRRAPDLSD